MFVFPEAILKSYSAYFAAANEECQKIGLSKNVAVCYLTNFILSFSNSIFIDPRDTLLVIS